MSFKLLKWIAPADAGIPSHLESCIRFLWYLACANVFVLFFVQGGYDVRLGLINVHATSLRNWLILCFGLSLIKANLEERRGASSAFEGLGSPLLLFLGAVTLYYSNGHVFETGDTFPARFLPVSLLRDQDFYLDELVSTINLYQSQYFVRSINGHIVSSYPPWGAILALPAYVIPVLKGGAVHMFDLEKRAAVLIMGLSVLVLHLALRRMTRPCGAWFIAFVYAFGTNSLSMNSQALWQHGPSQLFLSLTLYSLMMGMKIPVFNAWAGFPLGIAVICRPLNALMALPIMLYVLHKHRGQFTSFMIAGLPSLLLFLWYNEVHFGSPLTTGFGATVVTPASLVGHHLSWFNTPILEGIAGVLVSPARGLFVYSPIFLCALVGIWVVWKEPDQVFLRYLSLAPLLLLFPVAMLGSWWGGLCYGPRLLSDSTPFLCFLLIPALESTHQRPWLRYVVLGLAGVSVVMHGIGFAYSGNWNADLIDFDSHPERVWHWRESPPIVLGKQLCAEIWHIVAALL